MDEVLLDVWLVFHYYFWLVFQDYWFQLKKNKNKKGLLKNFTYFWNRLLALLIELENLFGSIHGQNSIVSSKDENRTTSSWAGKIQTKTKPQILLPWGRVMLFHTQFKVTVMPRCVKICSVTWQPFSINKHFPIYTETDHFKYHI